jgi:hypothetical protein
MLINKKKVKDLIKTLAPNKRISKEYYVTLDAKVKLIISTSVLSARRFPTIQSGDIQ